MFFRRTETRIAPAEGEVFQRRVAYDLVETARIKAVTTGPQDHRVSGISVSGSPRRVLTIWAINASWRRMFFHRCIIPPKQAFSVNITISSPRKA